MTMRNGVYSFKPNDPWIGVDLDATLAFYEKWEHSMKIRAMIEGMKQIVLQHLSAGQRVKIFTARMAHVDEAEEIQTGIQDWLEENGLPRLEATNIKDYKMLTLYDDRAMQVLPNKGITLDSAFSELWSQHEALKAAYDELKHRMDGLEK